MRKENVSLLILFEKPKPYRFHVFLSVFNCFALFRFPSLKMRKLSLFHHARNDPCQEMLVYESENIVFCRFANFREKLWWQITSAHNGDGNARGDARYNSLAPHRVLEIYSYKMHPWNILLWCSVTKIVRFCQHEFQGHHVSA